MFSLLFNKRREYNTPLFGLVLGSGLGDLIHILDQPLTIPYKDIPHFPETTVEGHAGRLISGTVEGVPILALQGRKHFYEVADQPGNAGILQTVFPVHVLANLGVRNYFVANAAGGLNTHYKVGDIMVIKSHINGLFSPLLGRHHTFTRVDNGARVSRFEPLHGAYDPELSDLLLSAGESVSDRIHEGVYLAVPGPTYETDAECIAFRDGLLADAVGMSTAPEVIVARNRGMCAVGFSCITNEIKEDGTNATNHEDVQAVLQSSKTKTALLSTVQEFFRRYKQSIS